jgi:hypothetical protein
VLRRQHGLRQWRGTITTPVRSDVGAMRQKQLDHADGGDEERPAVYVAGVETERVLADSIECIY